MLVPELKLYRYPMPLYSRFPIPALTVDDSFQLSAFRYSRRCYTAANKRRIFLKFRIPQYLQRTRAYIYNCFLFKPITYRLTSGGQYSCIQTHRTQLQDLPLPLLAVVLRVPALLVADTSCVPSRAKTYRPSLLQTRHASCSSAMEDVILLRLSKYVVQSSENRLTLNDGASSLLEQVLKRRIRISATISKQHGASEGKNVLTQ